MRDRVFYITCFGFLFGVLLRSFVFVDIYLVVLLGVVSLALLFFFTLISKGDSGILFSVFILAISLGILRFHLVDIPNPIVFESKVGQKVSLRGQIIDEPTIGENNQKLVVELDPIRVNGRERPVSNGTRVLVTFDFNDEFKYGDIIKFSGTLQKPGNFITDQGKEFDYINYLRKDGILYTMFPSKIEIVSRGNGNKVKEMLFDIKEKFLEKINFNIAEPENLLMGGLILGEKAAFSEELRQSFVDTGTIHIVALSGYNVTIISEWLMKLFSKISFVSKNFGIGVGIFSIILFIIMTGGSSTAIRAGIMATLALIARATGRNYDVARVLILAGVFMIIFNPFLLVFDVSFQLSFIATVAVIFLAPRIEKYFLWVPKYFELRDIVSVTTAAYIFVFPFILYKMGNFSLVALPANAFILPFIPLTMGLGFLTGFFGLIYYVFAVPFGYISYLFLHYELMVVNFFSNLPFASFSFPDFPLWLTLSIYAYFIYKLFGRNIKSFFIEPS